MYTYIYICFCVCVYKYIPLPPPSAWQVKCCLTRTMTGHQNRVGTLAWSGHTLCSGSRDRTICMRDVRSPTQFTSQLIGHKQEVREKGGSMSTP